MTGNLRRIVIIISCWCWWCCVLPAVFTTALTPFPGVSINPRTRRWVETSTNRERYWHGVNVVYKGIPFHPQTSGFDPTQSYSTQDMAILQDLGLNVIRLGAMWSGVEPTPNQYNVNYLETLKWIVDTNTDFGIWTVIDYHQDLLSEKYCGEGVPAWAAQPRPSAVGFPYPLANPYPIDNRTGFPSDADCARFNWPEYQFTEQSASAYQTLYTNTNLERRSTGSADEQQQQLIETPSVIPGRGGGVRDAFIEYWQTLATLFQSSPSVIGYEMINEPWAGDIFLKPGLMIPGVADLELLQPFFESVAAGIRQIDTNHVVLISGTTWDDFGVGFNAIPGGDMYHNMTALAYHFYIPPQLTLNGAFKARQNDFMKLGVGGFLTEFDIGCESDPILMHQVMDECDLIGQSWIGWEFKTYDWITGGGPSLWELGTGQFNVTHAKVLARTYATAVAGNLVSMRFNASSAEFNLVYTVSEEVHGSNMTEIYLHELYHYSNGFNVMIEPVGVAMWTLIAQNRIVIQHIDGLEDGLEIVVNIQSV